MAEFVFAEHHGRAIEASLNEGAWWIEFWDADEDEYAPPVTERTVDDEKEALRVILEWLTGC